jgi:Tol biopolymer transport system component
LSRRLWTAVALLVLLVVAACGDGDGDGQPDDNGAGEVTPTTAPDGAASPTPFDSLEGGRLGSEVTPPPVTPGTGEGPEPEGRIVFLSWRDGDREIFSINVDGSDAKNLTNDSNVDENPDVSPDGKRIAWVSDRGGDELELYVMDIDGSDVRQVTDATQSPRWSPDGKKIVFALHGSIRMVDVEGGEVEVVLAGGNPAKGEPCEAGGFPGGWSPDGQRITYYSADAIHGVSHVCIVDVDGSNVTVVPRTLGYHAEPIWSPDGRYLTFRSIRGGNHDVYTYDLETGVERRLTDDPATDLEPNWSPDGEWIVFGSGRDSRVTRSIEHPVCCVNLYIMRKDGSDVRRVTEHVAKDSEPVWVP